MNDTVSPGKVTPSKLRQKMYFEMLRIQANSTTYKNDVERLKARLRIFNNSNEIDQRSVEVQARARRAKITLNVETLKSVAGR